ncbi:MAG: MJ1255/VC2487 family glycosyltransferase [Nanoarchaeota archaeon]
MRILYGVSGDGFGHSSRALVIGKYLEKRGHKLIIVTYGQAYNVLKNKFNVFKIKGLRIIFRKGILKKRKTILSNFKIFPKNILNIEKFDKLMNEFKPDLCISDMEPVVPILSFWYKIPLMSIDNQHRITNLKISVPKKYLKSYLIAKKVINTFVRKADFFIVVSFTKNKILKKKTFVVPPIIREDVRKLKPVYKDKILVYLTRKNREILNTLNKIDESFVVYGYDKDGKKGNLEFKTKKSFLEDLRECKAIIGSSGFSLMSEAIYLKKPYFAIPLKGQFEQVLNSLFLKKAGFGEYDEEINTKNIKLFLDNLDTYRKNLKRYNPNYNEMFDVLDKTLIKINKIRK